MSNAAKLRKRAAEFEQKRQFDKAVTLYIQALQEAEGVEEDQDVPLYNRVGDLLLRSGNVNEALTYYEKAVDLYADRGFHNNAIALCNKILRQSPSRTSVYYKLGRISATKGFKTDAKKNFLEYADRMQKAGHLDEAFRALKEFADLCPDQDDIRLMLAEQLSREGRKEEALDQLQRLHEKLESEGRTTEARATVDRMKAIDPEFTPASTGGATQAASGDLVFLDLSDEPTGGDARRRPTDPDMVAVRAAGLETLTGVPPENRAETGASGGLELILPDDLGPPIDIPPLETERADADVEPIDLGGALEGLEITSFTPPPLSEAPPAMDFGELLVDEGSPAGSPLASFAEDVAPLAGLDRPSAVPVPDADVLDGALLDLELPTAVSPQDTATAATDDGLGDLTLAWPPDSPSAAIESAPTASEDAALRAEHTEEWAIELAPAEGASARESLTLESSLEAALSQEVEAIPEPAAAVEAPIVPAGAPPDDDAWRRAFPEDIGDSLPTTWSSPSPRYDANETPARSLDAVESPAPTSPVAESAPAEPLLAFDPVDSPAADPETLDAVRESFDIATPGDATWPALGTSVPDDAFAFPAPTFGASSDNAAIIEDVVDEPPSLDELEGLEFVEGAESLGGGTEEIFDELASPDPLADISEATSGQSTEVASEQHVAPASESGFEPSPERPDATGSWRDRTTDSDLETIVAEEPEAGVAEAAPPPETPLTGDALVASLRARLDETPGDWSLRRRYAEALFDVGRRSEGLAELEGAMVSLEVEGRHDEAIALVDELLALEPDSIRYLQKRVEHAVRSADRGMLVDAYVALADGLFRTGEADKAAVVYQRVLELAPDEPRARAGLTASGITPESAPAVATAPPPQPARVEAHWSDEVEDQPTPARSAAPSADSFIDLGDLLREDELPRSTRMVTDEKAPTGDEQADFEEMLRRFKQGVAENVDEEDYESHYDLGVAYKEMGLVDEAIAEFQKALRGTAGRARAYEALGQCFVEKEQYQVASSVLRRALTLGEGADDHTLVGVLYLLGQSCEHLGRPAEALDFYRRVFAVDIQFRDIADRITAMERMPQ